MKEATRHHILKQVHTGYDQISLQFADTRQYAWPEFDLFKPYLFPDAEILDLGCGNGRLIKFLDSFYLGNEYRYLGIDISTRLLEAAHHEHPGKVFLPGNMLDIPVDDSQVDLLFCIAAFHHVPSRKLRLQALKEMQRVLKPGGVLIVTVWNLWQWKYRLPIVSAIIRFFTSLGNYAFNDLFIPWKNSKGAIETSRYYHNFLSTELWGLFRECGLEIIRTVSSRKSIPQKLTGSFNHIVITRKK